jgi:alkylation response protein AidB-like acyl-CoA dehydrogenase
LNQVFFENVQVPVENRIGEENRGWTYAKFILGYERPGDGHGLIKERLRRLKEIAAVQSCGGRPLVEDPAFRDRLAQLEIDWLGIEYTNLRILSEAQRGRAPGVESSLVKVALNAFAVRVTEMMLEALGYAGAVWEPQQPGAAADFVSIADALGVLEAHLVARQSMIYGGTAEIQRNIIAKAALGL